MNETEKKISIMDLLRKKRIKILTIGILGLIFQTLPIVYSAIVMPYKGGGPLEFGDIIILTFICWPTAFVLLFVSFFQIENKVRIYGFDRWDLLALCLEWFFPILLFGNWLVMSFKYGF